MGLDWAQKLHQENSSRVATLAVVLGIPGGLGGQKIAPG